MVSRLVIRAGRVFDGTGEVPTQADVVIEAGRIVDIGLDLDGDDAVDAEGMTVLPGLFDCHVHVCTSSLDLLSNIQRPFSYQFYEAARSLSATLDCGITTVRDAGGADLGIQQAVDNGLIEGPRMRISVSALSQTGGHGDGWMPSGVTIHHSEPHPGRPSGIVDGPDEVRRKVREVVRAGADVIKVFTSGGVLSPNDDPRHGHFRDDELLVAVEEATAAGISVMAHAQATEGIKAAIRTGIRSVEHGIYLDDEAIAMMLERGTWLVPTLAAPQAVIDAAQAGARIPESSVRKAREVVAAHHDSFRRAAAAGVKVAMGTDSGVGPHGDNLTELELMANAGMAPADVLVATTSSAAELMGFTDGLGTLRPGGRADVVMVEGDAYDLSGLKGRIKGVWKDGVRVRG